MINEGRGDNDLARIHAFKHGDSYPLALGVPRGFMSKTNRSETNRASRYDSRMSPHLAEFTLFIRYLETDPVFYASAVVGMIFSIVLHELAHGWAAIREGDRTPIELGHMTPNPVTHMGPIGLAAVCLIGMGWGAMPVTPSRFKRKYSDAIVSFAGPLMNILIAIVSLTAFALWRKNSGDVSETAGNIQQALWILGYFNIALAIFNMGPVPPLDGSRVLANFHRPYAEWLDRNREHANFLFIAYFFLIMSLSDTKFGIFTIGANVANWFVGLLT